MDFIKVYRIRFAPIFSLERNAKAVTWWKLVCATFSPKVAKIPVKRPKKDEWNTPLGSCAAMCSPGLGGMPPVTTGLVEYGGDRGMYVQYLHFEKFASKIPALSLAFAGMLSRRHNGSIATMNAVRRRLVKYLLCRLCVPWWVAAVTAGVQGHLTVIRSMDFALSDPSIG